MLDGRELAEAVEQAAELLATVLGQDLDRGDDGVFRIARRVAKDRVISTVDPEARHGHKTSARGFDGYKGHIAVDPDTEIITATAVTPGNTGDAEAAAGPVADLLAHTDVKHRHRRRRGRPGCVVRRGAADRLRRRRLRRRRTAQGTRRGRGRVQDQGPAADHTGGRFTKDRFDIDLDAQTVRCPAGTSPRSAGNARVAAWPTSGRPAPDVPSPNECTTAKGGARSRVGPPRARLADARARRRDPAWLADYRATRPKVERKLAHLMRRRHGGRRARVRGATASDRRRLLPPRRRGQPRAAGRAGAGPCPGRGVGHGLKAESRGQSGTKG